MIPTREQAWGILTKYVTTDSQRKHGMAVEAAMRYFARKAGQDEELWGVVGLLHDVDYELYPEEPLPPRTGNSAKGRRGRGGHPRGAEPWV